METLKNGNFKGQNYDKIISLEENKKIFKMIWITLQNC